MPRVVYFYGRIVPALLLLGGSVAANPALAEDFVDENRNNLDVKTQPTITAEDKQIIARDVAGFRSEIFSNDRERLINAKDKLAGFVQAPGVTTAFLDALTLELRPVLVEAAEHQDPGVRIAAMVIVASTRPSADPDSQLVEILIRGLRDANPGVRYHAAKAVADLIKRGGDPRPFVQLQETNLFNEIKAASASETHRTVFLQMGRAMASLSVGGAFEETLAMLRRHIQELEQNPELLPETARQMIELGQLRIVQIKTGNQNNVDDEYRDLLAITGRCMAVLYRRVEDGLLQSEPGASIPLPVLRQRQSWAELQQVIESTVWLRASENFNVDISGLSPKPSNQMNEKTGWLPGNLGVTIEAWIGSPDPSGPQGHLTTRFNVARDQMPYPAPSTPAQPGETPAPPPEPGGVANP